jgi:MoaA/NifB/PqqE/SkfB family radical SAM enzyme
MLGLTYGFLTNLSYPYSDRQIEALARASELTVSFDTYDDEFHSQIRRRSSLRQLLSNLRAVTAKAEAEGHRPVITQNCVVTDRTVWNLPRVIREAPRHGINKVALLHIFKEYAPPEVIEYNQLDELAPSRRQDAIDVIRKQLALARRLKSGLTSMIGYECCLPDKCLDPSNNSLRGISRNLNYRTSRRLDCASPHGRASMSRKKGWSAPVVC